MAIQMKVVPVLKKALLSDLTTTLVHLQKNNY